MKSFEFWFDFGSPAAYLAWTQIPAIEASTGDSRACSTGSASASL